MQWHAYERAVNDVPDGARGNDHAASRVKEERSAELTRRYGEAKRTSRGFSKGSRKPPRGSLAPLNLRHIALAISKNLRNVPGGVEHANDFDAFLRGVGRKSGDAETLEWATFEALSTALCRHLAKRPVPECL